jgi:hypothetical protein
MIDASDYGLSSDATAEQNGDAFRLAIEAAHLQDERNPVSALLADDD